jgi:phospholipid/cholesterol/gamma-HCH transport system substrate-binding protein
MLLNRSARVGLTAIVSLACACVLVVFLGNIHFARPGYRVTILFNYVDSLKTSAPVLYGGGVKIGEVDSIGIVGDRVAVALNIQKDVHIPLDSELTIHTAGILGEKYVQIGAGDSGKGVVAPGSVLEGIDPGSLDRTLQKVESLSEYLEPLLKDPKLIGGLDHLLGGLDKASTSLNGMIDENRGDLRASVKDLRVLTRNLRQSSDQVQPLVANAGKLLSDANTVKVQKSLDSLDDSMAKMDHILTHVEDKKGTLGMLVFDDQTGENLRELLSDLKRHPWKLLWKK